MIMTSKEPKSNITDDDPSGWYECSFIRSDGHRLARWWSGSGLFTSRNEGFPIDSREYRDFLPLYLPNPIVRASLCFSHVQHVFDMPCPKCDYDEAEGGLFNHCDDCCRKIATAVGEAITELRNA